MKVNLNVSGFETQAEFFDDDILNIHRPLVKKFTDLYNEKKEKIIIFLCAPPGSGKSTLASFWEYLSNQDDSLEPIQVLPFDGFHFPNSYLENKTIIKNGSEVSLRSIKGSYETFDLNMLQNKLSQLKNENIKWSFYDRNLHDPVNDAIEIKSNIVIVEGNWLLLDKPHWRELKKFADYSVFIKTEPEYLQDRLVQRKIRGGLSEQQATEFYHQSDAINVNLVLKQSISADFNLYMNENGSFNVC